MQIGTIKGSDSSGSRRHRDVHERLWVSVLQAPSQAESGPPQKWRIMKKYGPPVRNPTAAEMWSMTAAIFMGPQLGGDEASLRKPS